MIYPIVIHKEKNSDYGVTVPDLPGCFSAGSTLDEAMVMAREAIELHIEGLIEDGEVIPQIHAIEELQESAQYRDGTWAFITVEDSALRLQVKRVNVTIPQRVLEDVDRAAASEHDTRSGLLTKAATQYLRGRSHSLVRGKRPSLAKKPWREK